VNPAAVVAFNSIIVYRKPLTSREVNPAAVVALNFLIVYRKPLHQQQCKSCRSSDLKLYDNLQKAALSARK
jgi:hypothetical protein